MTLPTHEFIRRFLTHVLPKGLHRIRHYGLFANGNRAANTARARKLLAVPSRPIGTEFLRFYRPVVVRDLVYQCLFVRIAPNKNIILHCEFSFSGFPV